MKMNIKIMLKSGNHTIYKDIANITKYDRNIKFTKSNSNEYLYEMSDIEDIKVYFEEEINEYYDTLIGKPIKYLNGSDIKIFKSKNFTLEELKKVFQLTGEKE